MRYLTATEVFSSVKTLTATEELTATITSFIKQEEAIVDGVLGFKYKLPIEESDETEDARAILKGIVLYKILARLEIFLNLQGDDGQALVDKVTYWSMYKNSINMIAKNKIKLKGVPLIDKFIASKFPAARFNRQYDQW